MAARERHKYLPFQIQERAASPSAMSAVDETFFLKKNHLLPLACIFFSLEAAMSYCVCVFVCQQMSWRGRAPSCWV